MFLVNNISTVRNSMDKKDLLKDSPSSLSLKLCNSGILLTKLRLQIPSIGKPHLKLNATHLSRRRLSNRNYLTHFVPNILDSTQMSCYRPGFKCARQHTGRLHPKYTLPFQSPMKSHWPILQRTAATRLLNGSITKRVSEISTRKKKSKKQTVTSILQSNEGTKKQQQQKKREKKGKEKQMPNLKKKQHNTGNWIKWVSSIFHNLYHFNKKEIWRTNGTF